MGAGNLMRDAVAGSVHSRAWEGYKDRTEAERVASQNRTDRLRQQAATRENFNQQVATARSRQPAGAAPVFTPGKQSSFSA